MSKSVVLVLESSYEQDYGEYANIPVFNAHGEIIGWTGGEVPEYGHPCEFNALNEEGFTSCASSAIVNRLRAENAKLRGLITDVHEALRADKAGMFHKLILASMEDDMQKLGIEEEPHD